MTVFVEPGNTQSTHHISLSDGLRIVGIDACDSQGNKNPLSITRAPVPRTALKTSSGDQKYSDFEPPWSPISQNSWLGGRGLDDAEADITRYFDGYCADTCFGTIFIGPQVQYAKGYRTTEDNVPGNVVWRLLQDTTLHNAGLVLSTVTATMQAIAMLIRCKGTPTASLTISIYTNTAGAPGTLLKSVVLTPASFTDTTSEWYRFMFSSTLAYVAATYYWIVFSSTAGTSKDHWEVGVKQLPSVDATCLSSPDGATWTTTDKYPYYRIEDVPTAGTWYLFRFRYLTYAYLNIDGAAPKLYKNGDRGMADANTGQLTTLIDGTKTWLTDQWEGYTVQLIGGTGAGEQQGWRTIVSNTATVLTVSPAWLAS